MIDLIPDGAEYKVGDLYYREFEDNLLYWEEPSSIWITSVRTLEYILTRGDTYEVTRLIPPALAKQAPLETPLNTQVGGAHYKDLAIQPMQYSMVNGLDACQHTAIKYITRHATKGGKEDLLKAIHCVQMLIEFKYPSKV
jgi:hypothetical protein